MKFFYRDEYGTHIRLLGRVVSIVKAEPDNDLIMRIEVRTKDASAVFATSPANVKAIAALITRSHKECLARDFGRLLDIDNDLVIDMVRLSNENADNKIDLPATSAINSVILANRNPDPEEVIYG